MKLLKLAVNAAFISAAITDYVEAKTLNIINPATEIEVAASSSYLKEKQRTDGRYFIKTDNQAIQTLEVGDSFQMVFVVDQKPYTGTVKNISTFENMPRLTGDFIEEKSLRGGQFSMTLSADGSYVAGNFIVGKDSYTFEAKNGMGWINDVKTEGDTLLRSH
jgi:hypothetical protein